MEMETLTEQLKNFELKIQSLKDQDLLQTLQKLLDREKRIGDAILLATIQDKDKKKRTSNNSHKSIQDINVEVQTFTASKQSPSNGMDKVNSLTDGGTDVKVKTNCKTKLDPEVSPINEQTLFLSQSSRGTRFIPQETRFIPQETKRNVFQRSGGCCEFIGKNGKRCHSKYQLEWDHVIPWSQGGGNDEKSLRIYCRTHNQYCTKETHGFWYRAKNRI